MTVCPIAIVASCKQCPAFKICPLKSVLGDHVAVDNPVVQPATPAKTARKRRSK